MRTRVSRREWSFSIQVHPFMRYRLHIAISIVALGLLAPMEPARAQAGVRSCGDGAGVVAGVVVDASTEAPVSGAMVRLWRDSARPFACLVSTGTDGSFVIGGRSAGIDSVTVRARDFRRPRSLTIEVPDQDTAEVEIALVPGTLVDECRDASLCRGWLAAPSDEGLTDEEAFQVVALQTAAVLAWKAFDAPFDAYICLPESTRDRVLDAVKARHSRTVPARDCKRLASEDGTDSRPRLRHVPTGEPAYALAVKVRTSVSPTERVVELSHHVASLWAEGWRCTFVQSDGAWRARSCNIEWVS